VLRREGPLAELCSELAGVDRLVVLGDALELRHGPVRDALAVAEPVFAAFGEALGAGAQIVLLAGNHDHALVEPWLEERGRRRAPDPLGLEERAGPRASDATARLAKAAAAGGAELDVAYPGIWLRDDVYATHGHYLDRFNTVPTFERLAAGAMARVVGQVPESGATPDDFESALAPLYAWMHAVAQTPHGAWSAGGQASSARMWQTLAGEGQRPLRARALGALLPVAIAAINRAGLGPVKPDLAGHELRRAGLRAMGEVVRRLGVDAPHVIFGHTHRAGPLPADAPGEWRVDGAAAQLHNTGSWIHEPIFARGDHTSPYWAGRAIEVRDDGAPPELRRLVEELGEPPAG
jgi:hypothetical protein